MCADIYVALVGVRCTRRLVRLARRDARRTRRLVRRARRFESNVRRIVCNLVRCASRPVESSKPVFTWLASPPICLL